MIRVRNWRSGITGAWWPARHGLRRNSAAWSVRDRVLVGLALAMLVGPPLLDLLLNGWKRVFSYFAADTFYYLTVARNLALQGSPTFDQERATGMWPEADEFNEALSYISRFDGSRTLPNHHPRRVGCHPNEVYGTGESVGTNIVRWFARVGICPVPPIENHESEPIAPHTDENGGLLNRRVEGECS